MVSENLLTQIACPNKLLGNVGSSGTLLFVLFPVAGAHRLHTADCAADCLTFWFIDCHGCLSARLDVSCQCASVAVGLTCWKFFLELSGVQAGLQEAPCDLTDPFLLIVLVLDSGVCAGRQEWAELAQLLAGAGDFPPPRRATLATDA